MERRTIIAGNWKMYKSHSEAISLVKDLLAGIGGIGTREVALFVPAPYARDVVVQCNGTPIDVGMQNMYFEKEGAFTGEVSPLMVKDCGCRYILIGHSERRHVFHENDADVNRKVLAALAHGLDPMICVGELLDERESGRTNAVVKTQVEAALAGVSAEQMKKIVIAYEPVWAIGTGKVATPEIAEEVHAYIRHLVSDLYGSAVSAALPILYGGSVKPDNVSGLFAKSNIDGFLVGGASLKADTFLPIIRVQ